MMKKWRPGDSILTSYVRHLSTRSQYHVLTALRGPDIKRETAEGKKIKGGITGRLRAIALSTAASVRGEVTTRPMNDQDLINVQEAILRWKTRRGPRHFIAHLRDAIAVTRTNKIWEGHGEALFETLQKAAAHER